MRFAVIGAAGQLGRDLCPRLPGDVVPLGRPDADLTAPDRLAVRLDEIRPDCVVNCAAYNYVDKAETEPEAAFAVNSLGVRALAKICDGLNAALVHFSTDYVFGFDEHRQSPYRTTDAPGPTCVYGMSKLLGEYAARAECPRHFVIRTCGLYGVWGSGGKGGNFVETMLRLAGQGKPLKVVSDQICTPTYTRDLAEATVQLIASNRYGLYQATNRGSASWFDFANCIFELSGLKPDIQPTPSREFAAAARRPKYSAMSNEELIAAGAAEPRDWRDALAAYLDERKQRQ